MTEQSGLTPDIAAEKQEQLRVLFPDVFCEGRLDFDKLAQVLGARADDSKERYTFTWNGKGQALRLAQTPSAGTLRPCPEESKTWGATQNLYLEGDNLEVLKLLQKSYHGKIKMIYIDPPYNTGGDFIYPDDFHDTIGSYLRLTGQLDGTSRISSNTEANGRFHTDWLNMMYPRLRLARTLLAEDGIIFISIDDNELANLKKISDEIFGETNFRNILAVRRYDKNINRQFMENGLPSLNVGLEYVLVYSKNTETKLGPVFREASEERSSFGYWKGFWNNADRPTMRYEILGYTPARGQWKWSQNLAEEAVRNYWEYQEKFADHLTLEEYWEKTGRRKRFLRRNPKGKGFNRGIEHWVAPSSGILRNSNWSDILASKPTGVDVPFSNPKNYELIRELAVLAGVESGDIVCDFFAGSATTAHAVFSLAQEGIYPRFILVQLPENLDSGLKAATGDTRRSVQEAISFLDNLGKPHLLTELGKERVRRAGEKIQGDADPASDLDLGFKVFKLDSSNFRKWQPEDDLERSLLAAVDTFVTGRTELDVVYELMLKTGRDLSEPVHTYRAAGQSVYSIGNGTLMICLADEISAEAAEEMIRLKEALAPETWQVIFKDNGFINDSTKINIRELLKAAGLAEKGFLTV